MLNIHPTEHRLLEESPKAKYLSRKLEHLTLLKKLLIELQYLQRDLSGFSQIISIEKVLLSSQEKSD
jgi:hypothetical protein